MASSALSPAYADWLEKRAQNELKNNVYAAKAWLITARTLFPNNFSIQFAAYDVEKNTAAKQEASKLFLSLFEQFPDYPQMIREYSNIIEALQNVETPSQQQLFLQSMFEALPRAAQYDFLLASSEKTSDKIEHCRLQMLLLRRFPKAVSTLGVKLAEMLYESEKIEGYKNPVNPYRKMLVCGVLPLLLDEKIPISESPKHLNKWLQRAISFYLNYAANSPSCKASTLSPCRDVKMETSCSGSDEGRKSVSSDDIDIEINVENVWDKLRDLLSMVAKKCGWDVKSIPSAQRDLSDQWSHLCMMSRRVGTPTDSSDPGTSKAIFYSVVLLYFQAVFKYIKSTQLTSKKGNVEFDPDQHRYVLLESPTENPVKRPQQKSSTKLLIKKKKLDDGTLITAMDSDENISPQVSISVIGQCDYPIATTGECRNDHIDSFLVAINCCQLLKSNDIYEKDFQWLCHRWKVDKWNRMNSFYIDSAIYEGDYRTAIASLHLHEETFSKQTSSSNVQSQVNTETQLAVLLQLSSCLYHTGSFTSACDMVLRVVSLLQRSNMLEVENQNVHINTEDNTKSHSLTLLYLSSDYILPYCISILLMCCKKTIFQLRDDNMLGHMIVLMQYGWPKHEEMFNKVMNKIIEKKSFTYELFFNYVINHDILEEIAYLSTIGVKLNLQPTPPVEETNSQTEQRMTRKQQKEFEDDLRIQLQKQICRQNDNIYSIMVTFLTQEQKLLIDNLVSRTRHTPVAPSVNETPGTIG